jgi:hypothetical protein
MDGVEKQIQALRVHWDKQMEVLRMEQEANFNRLLALLERGDKGSAASPVDPLTPHLPPAKLEMPKKQEPGFMLPAPKSPRPRHFDLIDATKRAAPGGRCRPASSTGAPRKDPSFVNEEGKGACAPDATASTTKKPSHKDIPQCIDGPAVRPKEQPQRISERRPEGSKDNAVAPDVEMELRKRRRDVTMDHGAQDHQDAPDHRNLWHHQDAPDHRDLQDHQDVLDHWDLQDHQDVPEHRDLQDHHDTRDQLDLPGHQDAPDPWDQRDYRDPPDCLDQLDFQDHWDLPDLQDLPDRQDLLDHRDHPDRRDLPDPHVHRGIWISRIIVKIVWITGDSKLHQLHSMCPRLTDSSRHPRRHLHLMPL